MFPYFRRLANSDSKTEGLPQGLRQLSGCCASHTPSRRKIDGSQDLLVSTTQKTIRGDSCIVDRLFIGVGMLVRAGQFELEVE